MTEKFPEEVIYQARLIIARAKFWTQETEKLLRRWRKQIRHRYTGHKSKEAYFKACLYGVGIPMTILSAVSAAGILASFQNCNACDPPSSSNTSIPGTPIVDPCAKDLYIRISSAILSVVAATLSSLFLFMDYGGSQKAHKDAASDCDALAREVEDLLNHPIPQRGDPIAELQKIRNKYDIVVQNSPSIPDTFCTALEYASFEKKNHYDHKKVVAPPTSNIDLTTLRQRRNAPDAAVLAKILVEDMKAAEDKKKEIEKANDYDTDEDKEVTLPFDPDSFRPGDILEDERTRIVRESLQRAMEFELSRFEESEPLIIREHTTYDDNVETIIDRNEISIEMNEISTSSQQSRTDLFDNL
ncbi:MAG TPA: SLATT domain-containing protein [Saprospiraceae bacterium]|nr:SLATT domain-containing protein [Saprospiraceae bacterium]